MRPARRHVGVRARSVKPGRHLGGPPALDAAGRNAEATPGRPRGRANGRCRVTDKLDQLYEAGLANRRKVLGRDYVDRAIAGADGFNAHFQRLLTTWCWGEI